MKTITVEDVASITPLSENEALKFISDNLDWYTEDYVSTLSQQQLLLDIAKRYLHSYEGWCTMKGNVSDVKITTQQCERFADKILEFSKKYRGQVDIR